MIQEVKDFNSLLTNSNLPLLVFFYSPVSGPDLLLNSTLEAVKNEIEQQLEVVKLDCEIYNDLASRYQIHALPTLIVFKDGQPVDRIETERSESLLSKESLLQRLKNAGWIQR